MASREHLKRLSAGARAWNAWRRDSPGTRPDLTGADLRKRSLRDFDLHDANLSAADLSDVSFRRGDLTRASLVKAKLSRTLFSATRLRGTKFHKARLYETVFANVTLSDARGLSNVVHYGPSVIDHRTFERSGDVPLVFLQGCGLPDSLIQGTRQMQAEAVRYQSCFISYSSQDEEFAKRLHADLQASGARCWFAPKDMPIGAKIRDALDVAIREMAKAVLVLSANTLSSSWVEKEFETAFEEERRRGTMLLLPIRLDAAPLTSDLPWVADIRRSRNIGDFSGWRIDAEYRQALARLLLALTEPPARGPQAPVN